MLICAYLWHELMGIPASSLVAGNGRHRSDAVLPFQHDECPHCNCIIAVFCSLSVPGGLFSHFLNDGEGAGATKKCSACVFLGGFHLHV